jgi:hypothetical protein
MYSRQAGRFTLPGFGGPSGPPPRDVIAILAVLFVTFSCQFFPSTRKFLEDFVRLSPTVWQRGFVWQIVTYPFAGTGESALGIVFQFLVLFWFTRDVYLDLGRRRFWRLILASAIVAAVAALLVDFVAGPPASLMQERFPLMQGQYVLLAIVATAFGVLHRDATIYLFFVLPVRGAWLPAITLLVAFLAFLEIHNLAGFVGLVVAAGFAWWRPAGWGYRGNRGGKSGGLKELRLRLRKRFLEWKLGRLKKRRPLRAVPSDREPGGQVRKGPWVH